MLIEISSKNGLGRKYPSTFSPILYDIYPFFNGRGVKQQQILSLVVFKYPKKCVFSRILRLLSKISRVLLGIPTFYQEIPAFLQEFPRFMNPHFIKKFYQEFPAFYREFPHFINNSRVLSRIALNLLRTFAFYREFTAFYQ